MPLRCVGSDGEELAFVHDEVSWESLRLRNKQHDDLRLPCCNSPVSLKTSKLGTRFFAHKRRDGCASGPETPEHILAKSIIAAAAMDAGWQVRPEERYLDEDGTCIVDVSCRKPESSRGLAFEIQWSRQKPDVTEARTQRYERHGLRSLWLMRQTDVPVSRSTPAVIVHRYAAADTYERGAVDLDELPPHLQDWIEGLTERQLQHLSQSALLCEAALSGRRTGFAGMPIPARPTLHAAADYLGPVGTIGEVLGDPSAFAARVATAKGVRRDR